jgi:hypothetical protein
MVSRPCPIEFGRFGVTAGHIKVEGVAVMDRVDRKRDPFTGSKARPPF